MITHHRWRLSEPIRSFTFGFVICVVASGLLASLLRNSDASTIAPLVLLTLVPFVARYFGAAGVAFGIAVAALMFASILFRPLGSLSVERVAERDNLLLLLTLGIPTAYFLGSRTQGPPHE
jgi:O-antigen ligase